MIPLADWIDSASPLDFNGRRFAYWKSEKPDDEKPWLLLIHGFPTSSWDWSAMWASLETRFNLAAIDMLGFGLSEKPSQKYSIFDQADYQEALLTHLAVSEAHILAHDYGDTVAQELLARQQENGLSFSIKSVCFLNGGLFAEMHRPRPLQKLGLTPIGFLLGCFINKTRFQNSFDEIFGLQTKASEEEIDGHWRLLQRHDGHRVVHKILKYIPERTRFRDRWVSALMNAHQPLKLIIGGTDPVSGKHLYDYYCEQIPNADAVLFDTIGHYPQTEAPEQTLAEVFAFHDKTKVAGNSVGAALSRQGD